MLLKGTCERWLHLEDWQLELLLLHLLLEHRESLRLLVLMLKGHC